MIGNITEVSCMLEFLKLGYNVLMPYGDCERYDFVADINNNLYRIQVKTANDSHIEDGYITFRCSNRTTKEGKNHQHVYTKDEIDFFTTFYDGKCYLVPVGQCSSSKTLRFCPPKNGQIKGITFAKDYELEEVIKKL